MVRRLIYIILLLMPCSVMASGNKHALTVFISDYPQESGWNTLNSVNDKTLIMPMLQQMGYDMSRIISLEDDDATYANIKKAFERLIAAVQRGDEVYIHFSCHGQQITDIDGDESLVNAKDKLDEALVPYDAYISYGWNGYRGEHHLLDDTVNAWLHQLSSSVGKEGSVIFVADACHSGDIKRTADSKNYSGFRGTFDTFRLPLPTVKTGRSSRELNWISISACKDFQTNYECEVNGVKYGRLTYALSQCVAKGMTVSEMLEALGRKYTEIPLPKGKAQTLMAEYPERAANKTVFR